jgi:D-glycero-D-manno-heptose 1,7-bisphosphate phosphatase
MLRRAVFLGRDGVINRYIYNSDCGTVNVPATPDEFELLPGAGEAIRELNRMRLPVVVASNQPGIALGRFTTTLLDAINEKMRAGLAEAGARTDGVLYCRHDPDGCVAAYQSDCECRKPKPGMLLRAARERNLNLAESFLVGNGVDDVLAGRAAGLMTFLVAVHGSAALEESSRRDARPDCAVRNLSEAVRLISLLVRETGEFGISARRFSQQEPLGLPVMARSG